MITGPVTRLLPLPAAALLLAATLPVTADAPPDAAAVLRGYVRATDAELRRLDRGGVLTKTLDAPDGREISSFGAIRVTCTPDVFVERLRDIERFKASEYVLQIGRFRAEPAAADLAALKLDPSDRDAMRACRPGSCSLRLPDAAIERFRTAVPWGTAGEAARAEAEMRQFLLTEARTYLSRGSAGMPDYADRPGALRRAPAFHELLRRADFKAEHQPALFDWLERFPYATLDGADSFLYWSREKFGLKPTISISHAVLVRRPDAIVFGSKQVFASHYFESSLGMALFVPAPGTSYGYVTYLNRSRVDTLHGLLAPLARLVAARRARDGLERMLIGVREKLERPTVRPASPPALRADDAAARAGAAAGR